MLNILPESEMKAWRPRKTYTPFFPMDWQNYYSQNHCFSVPTSPKTQKAVKNYYPVSQELQDFIAEQTTDWDAFEARVEKMLAGVDESEQDDLIPWIPGEFYLPLENPNNSTDYQDDFDPLDYRFEDWNSDDGIDDHHVDNFLYAEVGMVENPIFNEDGNIEWENPSDITSALPDNESESVFVKQVMENLFDANAENPYFFHLKEAKDELTEWVNKNLSDIDLADSDLENQDQLVEWMLNEMQAQATHSENQAFTE